MDEKTIAQHLAPHLPAQAVPILAKWAVEERVGIVIAAPRNSKLGDYRPPFQGKGHRISVNSNLNPYAFLVTFVHEFAHLYTWKAHQRSVQPHGTEWKRKFQELMFPFLKMGIFPKPVHDALHQYMQNPAASSCRDQHLMKALDIFNEKKAPDGWVAVEELPHGQVFVVQNGQAFIKGERLRKYFKCQEVQTGRLYRVNALALAHPLEK